MDVTYIILVVIFYLLGYMAVYKIMKMERVRENKNTWIDVIGTIFISCFSWLTFICMIPTNGEDIEYLIKKIVKKDPPKWL